MNARLAIRLFRRAAVPHAYLPRREVKDTVTPLAIFLTIRQWHVAGCLKLLREDATHA